MPHLTTQVKTSFMDRLEQNGSKFENKIQNKSFKFHVRCTIIKTLLLPSKYLTTELLVREKSFKSVVG
jgi:hypothetical protein